MFGGTCWFGLSHWEGKPSPVGGPSLEVMIFSDFHVVGVGYVFKRPFLWRVNQGRSVKVCLEDFLDDSTMKIRVLGMLEVRIDLMVTG